MNKSFKINLFNLTGGARQPDPITTVRELMDAYNAGRREFQNINLTNADLINENFTNANLTGANLTGATLTLNNFTGANFTNANFFNAGLINANLTNANLTGANLTGVDLSVANLTNANLTGADLTGAILTNANLTGANLEQANLTKTDLTGTSFDRRTNLKNVNFGPVNFGGIPDTPRIVAGRVSTIGIARNVKNFTWELVEIQNDGRYNYIIPGAGISNATDDPWPFVPELEPVSEPEPEPEPEPSRDTVLEAHTNPSNDASRRQRLLDFLQSYNAGERNFQGIDLSSLDLRNRFMGGADLTGAYFIDANLTGAILRDANLTDADLTDADLTGANLTGAILIDAYFIDANLTGAILTDANLTNADLTDADLTGANLELANLTDADLTNTSFDRRTNLKNVNFGTGEYNNGIPETAHIEAGTVSTIGIARNVPNFTWELVESPNVIGENFRYNYIIPGTGISNATDEPWPYPATSTPEPSRLARGVSMNLEDIQNTETDPELQRAIRVLRGQSPPPEPVRELGYTEGQDAWEIHNRTNYSFKRIKKYLELLVTQESLNLDPIDSLLEEMVEMRDWRQDDKSKDVFKKLLMFYKLFYKKLDGAKDLDEGLRKIFNKVKGSKWKMNSERSVELSIYALKYMIKTNDEELLKRFMERYVEETVGAYTSGTDGTSCVKGCQERILLYFDEQLRARCCSQGAKCDWIKEDIKLKICLLPIEIALNNIYKCKKTATGYSGKDCEVFMSYLQKFTSDANAEKDEKDQKDDPLIVLDRQENLKTFLFEKFSQGITDRDEIAQLKKAINNKITEMVASGDLNFNCKDLDDIMTDPKNCKMVEISDEVRKIVEDYKKAQPHYSPLYSSIHYGSFDNFKKLIPFYDVNKKYDMTEHWNMRTHNMTTLIAASFWLRARLDPTLDGKTPPNFEIIKYLIEAGADPNVIHDRFVGNALYTIIIRTEDFPKKSEIIKLLINSMSVEGLNNNNNNKGLTSYDVINERYEGSDKNEILDLIKAKGGKSGV